MTLRFGFLGSPPFAVDSLQLLLERGMTPSLVVTAPPRRAGRGRKNAPNPIAERAHELGIPLLRPTRAGDAEFINDLAGHELDLGVVVSYGQLLPQALLDLPKFGCINLHGSLLPRWRGASPIQAALRAGDVTTGVSLQKVVLELDAGPVLAEAPLNIAAKETCPELFLRVATAGAHLLADFLEEMGEGPLPEGIPQDLSGVTHCRKINPEDGQIDWTSPAVELERLVRAMVPWPCAKTVVPGGDELKIHSAEVVQSSGRPGEILGGPGFLVACGQGALRLLKVQRAGKSAISGEDFLRGAALSVGNHLGLSE